MSNLAKIIFTLQNSATANVDGEILSITPDMNTANIEIVSTSTSANINFEAQTATDTWHPINGVNLESFMVSTSVSAINGVYQVDLAGLRNVRARISDITSGEVTVIARVVS